MALRTTILTLVLMALLRIKRPEAQENFFKYLREEFLLDALVDYQVEPDDPDREVPNPAWAATDAKLREIRAEIARLTTTLRRRRPGESRARAARREIQVTPPWQRPQTPS
jgi:hypothetical protein